MDKCFIKTIDGKHFLFLPNGEKIDKQIFSIVENYMNESSATIGFLNIDEYFEFKNNECFYNNLKMPYCKLLSNQIENETSKKVVIKVQVNLI